MNLWKILLVFILTCCAVCSSLFAEDVNSSLSKPRLLLFAGQRNRSHFKLLKDPKISKYFAPDFVWDIRHFKDREEFLRMVKALRNANPKTVIGCYTSACLAVSEKKATYPTARVPLERCSPEWLVRDKDGNPVRYPLAKFDWYFLDVRRWDVRQAVISFGVARAKHLGLDAVCFDNCYWDYVQNEFTFSVPEWREAFMKFFSEAGKACHKEGLKCVVNVVLNSELNIPKAFPEIAPYVDGLLTELAFNPRFRTPEAVRRELETYEDVLKKGKLVLLIPYPRVPEQDEFVLEQIKPLARRYGSIYMVPSDLKEDKPMYWLSD